MEGGDEKMAYELQVPEEEAEERRGVCDRQQVLMTLRLMEKGTKQAFLDNELGVEDTKIILDRVRQAREACEAGSENACVVLDSLMDKLTKGE